LPRRHPATDPAGACVHIGLIALSNERLMMANPQGGRVMNIAFAILSTVLALLTAGAATLHLHNSLEIDHYLSGKRR
jgi:hypothetical protein